jgi:hypothetical protein
MPVRVEQPSDMAPGNARLRGRAPDGLSAEDAEIRIARIDLGAPRFLDPRYSDEKAWGAAECWFRPERMAGGPGLTLGPSVTWHLKPHMPYLTSFRDAEGKVVETRMSWPAIRLPSDTPPPSQAQTVTIESPVAARSDTEDEAEPRVEDPLAAGVDDAEVMQPEPIVEEVPEQRGNNETRKAAGARGRLMFALTGLLLVIAVGAFLAFYEPGFLLDEPGPLPDQTVVAEPKPAAPAIGPALTLQGARAFLKARPAAADAATQATRFTAAGKTDEAFLLNAYAARGGNPEAALRLGDLYNPASWTPGVLKSADADRAAGFYRQAAEAGVVAAMEKLAALLESGKTSLDDAPEQATFWRRKAEEAGTNIGEVTE